MLLLNLVAVAALALSVAAHPKLTKRELKEYHAENKRTIEALAQCLETRELQDITARINEDRAVNLAKLRKKRDLSSGSGKFIHGIQDLMSKHDIVEVNLHARGKDDLLRWLSKNHEHVSQHSQDVQDLFSFKWSEQPGVKKGVCALAPESIYGPFWKNEHPERSDIRDGQDGIYMRLAVQVIDVSSCKPMNNVVVEIWHANANGEYSGEADGFLRGRQMTTKFGTAEFDSIFPGHYYERSTHVHSVVREKDGRATHVGMLYFDELPRMAIESHPAYTGNPNNVTFNKDDDFAPLSSSKTYDPFMHWAWIGKFPVINGILTWITIGVNTTNSKIAQPPSKRSLLNLHLAE